MSGKFCTPVIAFFGQYDSVWTKHSGSFIFSVDINDSTALLMYRCTKKLSNRHIKDHEPTVCAYLGIMILCKTRKRDLHVVDTFFKLGLFVSYHRVLEISTSMAYDRYVKDGIVCPTNLLQHVFTSSAIENIDHNPSSLSSKDSFDGTGISLFQHISEDVQGVVQTLFLQSEHMLKCQSKRVSLLPLQESYSNLPPAVLRFNEPDIPLVEGELSIDMSSFPAALKGKLNWLKHVAENSSLKAKVGKTISWSAYHAVVLPDANKLPAVSALLPLFHEQAKFVAFPRHSLNTIRFFSFIIQQQY
ncbi:Hypothetical predicted protein [Mytilus galloprovincialis]|uniref:Uncharacterized protein n=1 Tax=Mytilus galloprovincialis TaxID=29158 RepID=A0A8B6C9I5_MYTGA|nr:Hypothetical predicted protein [Mytilus galloprovincialis]